MTATPPNRSRQVRAARQRRLSRNHHSQASFASWDASRPPQEYIGSVGGNTAVYLLQRYKAQLTEAHHLDAFRMMVKYFTWCRQRIDLSDGESLPPALSSGVHVHGSMREAVDREAPMHTQAYPMAGKQQLDTIMYRFRSPTLRDAFFVSVEHEVRQCWQALEQRRADQLELEEFTDSLELRWQSHWHKAKTTTSAMIERPLFHVMIQMQRHGLGSITSRCSGEVTSGDIVMEESFHDPTASAALSLSSQIFGPILRPACEGDGEMTAFFSLGLEAVLVKAQEQVGSQSSSSTRVEIPSNSSPPLLRDVRLYTELQTHGSPVPLQMHFMCDRAKAAFAHLNVYNGVAFFPKYGDLRVDAPSPIAIQMPHNTGFKCTCAEDKKAAYGLAGVIDTVATGGRELSPVLTMYETASKRPYSKKSFLHQGQNEIMKKMAQIGAVGGSHSQKAASIHTMLVGGRNSLLKEVVACMDCTERPFPLRIELIMPMHVEGNADVVSACSSIVKDGFQRMLGINLVELCGITQADAYPNLVLEYTRGIINIVLQHLKFEVSLTGMVSLETLTNAVSLLGSIASIVDNPSDTFLPFQEVMQRSGYWREFAARTGFLRPHAYMLAPGRCLSLAEGYLRKEKVDIWGWDVPPVLRIAFRTFKDSYRVHGVTSSSLEQMITDLIMATLPYIRPTHHHAALLTLLGTLHICWLINMDISKDIKLIAYKRRFGGGDVLAQVEVGSVSVFGSKVTRGRQRQKQFALAFPTNAKEMGLRANMSHITSSCLKKIANSSTWFPAGTFSDGRSVQHSQPTSYNDFAQALLLDMKTREIKAKEQSMSNKRVTDTAPARIVFSAYRASVRTMALSFGVPEKTVDEDVDAFMSAVILRALYNSEVVCIPTFSASSWRNKKMVS